MFDEDDARQAQQDNQDSYMQSLENEMPVADIDNVDSDTGLSDDWHYDY